MLKKILTKFTPHFPGKLFYILACFLILALLPGIMWAMPGVSSQHIVQLPTSNPHRDVALAQVSDTVRLPPFISITITQTFESSGVPRLALLHTNLPERPRYEVTQYTVVSGDTVFGIADKFRLKPSTILWGNLNVLGDNPEAMRPGQQLVILPEDGAYYQWHDKDSLIKVANYFHVKPEDILNYPGNHLDASAVTDIAHPGITSGTWLIVPKGQREFISWSAPQIPRSNPAVAKLYGPGACGQVIYGAVGSGSFVWPTTEHWLSGYDYNPGANHPAIDIAGKLGNPIFAADAGVVVYAGWNNWGYGNVVVLDHGNGWQTLYAHQNSILVGCGQSVSRGEQIGYLGTTGNSSGPHLHFEMMLNGTKVNPHQYLP